MQFLILENKKYLWFITALFVLAVYFQVIFPTFYCVIVYYMTAQPEEAFRFVGFTFWTILTAIVAQALGLLLGAASPSVQVILFGK